MLHGKLRDVASLLMLRSMGRTCGPQLQRGLSTFESSTPVKAEMGSRESYLADLRRSFMGALHRNDAAQALELRKMMGLGATSRCACTRKKSSVYCSYTRSR